MSRSPAASLVDSDALESAIFSGVVRHRRFSPTEHEFEYPIHMFMLKADELPQLVNVFKGEMSMVGPRPNLLTQDALIAIRRKFGIYATKPGITGLAQIQGIDMSDPEKLALTDQAMIRSMSCCNYFKFIFVTILGAGFGDKIRS